MNGVGVDSVDITINAAAWALTLSIGLIYLVINLSVSNTSISAYI